MEGKKTMFQRAKSLNYLLVPLAALILLVVSTGCEDQPTEVEKYDPQPFLFAYLTNGEPIDEVFLERGTSLFEEYNVENAAISDAEIKIIELGDDGIDRVDSIMFDEDYQQPGRYIPEAGAEMIPKGKTYYRIEATTPQGEFLWSETAVPDTFQMVEVVLIDNIGNETLVEEGDTLTRNDPNMYWRWDIDTTGGCVGGFAGLIVAETPRDSLVPLDPDWDPNDPDDELEDDERGAAGWTVFRYDARWTTIAWVFFNWAGPNRIELQAISAEYYDYLFSSFRVMQGLLENPIFNVEGGYGIFAGMSKKSFLVYMKRVED